MKSKTLIRLLVVLTLIVGITACQKSLSDDLTPPPVKPEIKDTTHTVINTDTGTAVVNYPQKTTTRCPGATDYGDSIFFTQPGPDYIISPINHPDTGTYFSWPQGMIIDKNTGAINVSKSETGLRYSIGYVKKGTTDTCMQPMVLAGISYEDSLYVLNSNQRYASPYYNANPSLPAVCTGSTTGCIFDVTGQAAAQHVFIDKNTGVIDLKNTANLAFGLIPVNGTTVQSTISYRLNDNSNMALQQITVNLIYYNKKSDVPPDLLAAIADKLNKIVNQILLINLLPTADQQVRAGNPRPPIIIVTRSAQ